MRKARIYRTTEKFPVSDAILGYVCGFISADGCLSRRSTIAVALQVRDSEFLSCFRGLISTSNEIKFYQHTRNYCKFAASLPQLYQYCLDMGITPKKSLTLDVKLEGKSDEFKFYYLRGAIDGDGCIVVRKTLASSRISLASASKVYLETLQDIFGGVICCRTKNRFTPLYELRFAGYKGQLLANQLPQDIFTLNRKTIKLQELQKLKSLRAGTTERREKYEKMGDRYWVDLYKEWGIQTQKSTVWARIQSCGWDPLQALIIPVKGDYIQQPTKIVKGFQS